MIIQIPTRASKVYQFVQLYLLMQIKKNQYWLEWESM